jgi:integral membrane protein
MNESIMTPKKLFNAFAKAEAVTWTLLIAGLIGRSLGLDSSIVTVVGGIHGAVFLGYAVTAALTGVNQRWGFGKTTLAVALAILPYATIPFEMRVAKNGSLEGSWRTAVSEDPRDKVSIDRLFRWFIARPVFLIVFIVVGLTALFSLLVSLGPPNEWFD